MTTDPRADIVSSQYERWIYPEPITDLPGWLEQSWQWFDPSNASRMLWPAGDQPDELEILIAGCGANQAAVLAYTNPRARVTAIDVSDPSLEHHRHLKEVYGLGNLDLHLLPIEEVGTLDRDFDLIISTGVLHHLADPNAGMAALARRLRPNGVAGIMLYAHYGRIGVEVLQGLFREMGLQQDEASLQVVKDTLASLPETHPIHAYLPVAPDLRFDAGLVDTFLHGRDRSYTVDECIELVTSAGLVFDDWFLKQSYYPPVTPQNAMETTLLSLPRERQWAAMERIATRNACHFFTARRPECAPETYRIDFASPAFLDYVPSFRHRCRLTASGVEQNDWSIPLNETQRSLLRWMDGRHTIGEILAESAAVDGFGQADPAARERYGRELFQSLWQLDVLAMGLRSG